MHQGDLLLMERAEKGCYVLAVSCAMAPSGIIVAESARPSSRHSARVGRQCLLFRHHCRNLRARGNIGASRGVLRDFEKEPIVFFAFCFYFVSIFPSEREEKWQSLDINAVLPLFVSSSSVRDSAR